MKTTLALLVTIAFAMSANAGNTVTCKLTSLKNKSISVTFSPKMIGNDVVASGGQGLNIGSDNYSFSLSMEEQGNRPLLSVTLYENNNVQDEIGSFACDYNPNGRQSVFCQEPVKSDSGKLLANFSCANN